MQLRLSGQLRQPNFKPGESFSFLTNYYQTQQQQQQENGTPTKAEEGGHCWQQSRRYVIVECSLRKLAFTCK